MGIQKKHGKGRLDKWYKLAKEKGYRARAAFKLIQLNRKYKFLENSKVLVDLCAAPGSWCQVAAETMPANSLIIGVDLAPIRPIPRTITFQSDITTDSCRATLRAHLKTWKAETVLHDGAPNVGTAWVHDAFSQAELVLQALKLATEVLGEGGTFVTKVFRSKDYNPLLWVFNQLFSKVDATKPPSSRNVSAEIFVICRGFKAPKRLDPKLLDPRLVFAELANPTADHEAKVFKPERRKRKRGGYEEGEYTQFQEAFASHFIQSTDPILVLASLSKLTFQQKRDRDMLLEAIDQSPSTTAEIRQCCDDLKVLGRKEFRMLLRWRLQLREKFGFVTNYHLTNTNDDDGLVDIAPMDDNLRLQQELSVLNDAHISRRKREKRRENATKQREIIRMQMHMLAPTDIGLEQNGPNGEDQLFGLNALKNQRVDGFNRHRGLSVQGAPSSVKPKDDQRLKSGDEIGQHDLDNDKYEDIDEDRLDSELDLMYVQYQARKASSDMKYRAKKARQEYDDDWEGIANSSTSENDRSGFESESESESELRSVNVSQDSFHDHLGKSVRASATLTRRASLFFDQDDLKDIIGDVSQLNENHIVNEDEQETSMSTMEDDCGKVQRDAPYQIEQFENEMHSQGTKNISETAHWLTTNPQEDIPSPMSNQIVTYDWQKEKQGVNDALVLSGTRSRPNIEIITAEAMTLAHQMASGEKRSSDVIDEGFNKYAFMDRDGLPDWFLDDESKHSKPHRPITAAAASVIKEKVRALNARPIKKVREARDRKKYKMAQRLEKLLKRSALIADEEGLTEKDKATNIAQIMSKRAKTKLKQRIKVVVARGSNRGISGRPRGVRGKYKLVDGRLKKDVRAEKRIARRQ